MHCSQMSMKKSRYTIFMHGSAIHDNTVSFCDKQREAYLELLAQSIGLPIFSKEDKKDVGLLRSH